MLHEIATASLTLTTSMRNIFDSFVFVHFRSAIVLLGMSGFAGLSAHAQTTTPNYTAPLVGCMLGGVPGDVTRPTCAESWEVWYGGDCSCTPNTITAAQPITCTCSGTTTSGSPWAFTVTQHSYPFYACIYGGVGGPALAPFQCEFGAATVNKVKNLGDCHSGNKDAQLVGETIHPATGNTYHSERDYSSPPLEVVRHYNGQKDKSIVHSGMQWRHSYSPSIRKTPAASTTLAAAERQSGRVVLFSKNTLGVWVADGNSSETLIDGDDGGMQLALGDNSIEMYDADGKLISTTDKFGRHVTLQYDANGKLTSVTDDIGRQLLYEYDSSDRIVKIVLPDGSPLFYAYDSRGNLDRIQFADGAVRKYLYNEPDLTSGATLPNALTGIVDETGKRIRTLKYDTQGRGIAVEGAGGTNRYTVAYETGGSVVTNPLLTPGVHQFQSIAGVTKKVAASQAAGAGCGPASAASVYDAYGNLSSRVDLNGNTSCFAYDLNRSLEVVRLEGLAPGTGCPSDLLAYVPVVGSAEKKTTTAWHSAMRRPVLIVQGNRKTEYVYDSQGKEIRKSVMDLTTGARRVWTSTYTYGVGNFVIQKVEDGPRSGAVDSSVTDYYSPTETCAGALFGCRGQVKRDVNAAGHATRYTQYNVHAQPTEIIGPNGVVTTISYDRRQRVTAISRGSLSIALQYDAAGRLVDATQSDGASVALHYADTNRLTKLVDPGGNVARIQYDLMGNPTREEILTPTESVSRIREWSLDALGRVSRTTDPHEADRRRSRRSKDDR